MMTMIIGDDDDAVIVQWGVMLCVRSTFAVDGAKMKVNKQVERVIQEFHRAKKPIG